MLKLVTKESEIAKCQKQLEKTLKAALPLKKEIRIGYPSGSWMSKVGYNSDIWYANFFIDEENKTRRFWNGFGLSNESEFNTGQNNNIAVEINITEKGINRSIRGAFVIDDKTKEVMLIHRGRVNGFTIEEFKAWYPEQFISIHDDKGNHEEKVLVIGAIESSDFIERLTDFVKNVVRFKNGLEPLNHPPKRPTKPHNAEIHRLFQEHENVELERIEKVVLVYRRNQMFVAQAKECAEGKCQLCGCDAPFENENGEPYLEVHHIQWLSQGGVDALDNVVALCPNCHRKMHILNLEEDVAELTEIAELQW
ncbi:MAG: HNH endonuclease [Methylococcaceae bacterium]